MIAIIVPTRGRVNKFKTLINSVAATTTTEVVVYAGINVDDVMYQSYAGLHSDVVKMFTVSDMPTAFTWNTLAAEAIKDGAKWLVLCGDDVIFETNAWDKEVNAWNELSPTVLAGYDCRGDNSFPHPIVSRDWYNRLGYLCHPSLFHWYVDTMTIDLAKATNNFYQIDIVMRHKKDSDDGFFDDTNTRIRNKPINKRDKAMYQLWRDRYMQKDIAIIKAQTPKELEV